MTSPTLDPVPSGYPAPSEYPAPAGYPGGPGYPAGPGYPGQPAYVDFDSGPAPVPEPPQGPGVYPPFPAPPVEGRGRRLGLGLGIGAGVLALVCGGGVVAVIGLVTVMKSAVREQVHVVVGDYFDALEAKKYDDAYGMLCQDERDHVTQDEFVNAEEAADPIASHSIGDLGLTSVDLTVPVHVTYTDGQTGTLQVYLAQSSDTGGLQVCGVEE
jgi:hypothetical protein